LSHRTAGKWSESSSREIYYVPVPSERPVVRKPQGNLPGGVAIVPWPSFQLHRVSPRLASTGEPRRQVCLCPRSGEERTFSYFAFGAITRHVLPRREFSLRPSSIRSAAHARGGNRAKRWVSRWPDHSRSSGPCSRSRAPTLSSMGRISGVRQRSIRCYNPNAIIRPSNQ
jgi:hypothetical protein